jgi:hypothetical protein
MRTLALILALTACADTPAARYDACTDYRAEVATCAPWTIPRDWPDTYCDERADTRTLREWRCWTEYACATRLSPQAMCSDED